MNGNAIPVRRRRWLSFSLRSLLLLVLLICIGLAWLTSLARRNDELIKSAERIAGVVEFEPIGPAWLRNLLGNHAPREPKRLTVPEAFIPQAIALIEEHPSIRELKINQYWANKFKPPTSQTPNSDAVANVRARCPEVVIMFQVFPTGPEFQETQSWATAPPYCESRLDPQCGEYRRMERLLAAYDEQHPGKLSGFGLTTGDALSLKFWKVPVRVGDLRFELAAFQEHEAPLFVCLILQDAIVDLQVHWVHRSSGFATPILEDVDHDGQTDVAIRGIWPDNHRVRTQPGTERQILPPVYYSAYRITPEGFVNIPLVDLERAGSAILMDGND